MHKAEEEMAREYYKELMEQESIPLMLVSSLSGLIPAILFLFFISGEGKIPLVFLVVPGLLIGFCARVGGGNGYRFGVKLIPAVISGLLLVGVWLFLGGTAITLFMAIPNAIAGYYIGKRPLTKRQELAIHRVKRGIVKL